MDNIPRRIQMEKMCQAELVIIQAKQEIEKMPADVRLTDAQVLLSRAQSKVADFVDNIDLKEPARPEVGELIEKSGPDGVCMYLSAGPHGFLWTQSHEKALRFARAADAAAMLTTLKAMYELDNFGYEHAKVVTHMWG